MDARLPRRIETGVAVLLVVSLLLEACGAAPADEPANSRQDAQMLLLAIHSVVLGEEDAEDAGVGPHGGGVLLRPVFIPSAGPIEEVKAAIADVQAQCAEQRVQMENLLPEADKTEAIAALDGLCQAELARLGKTLQELRAARGKPWWRRTWLGRRLASVWQTVKKNRRAIVLALLTGGVGLAKKALIDAGRAALRKELKTALGRGLARKGVRLELLEMVGLSPGTWPPARPAAEQAEVTTTESPESEEVAAPESDVDELLITAEVTDENMVGPSGASLTWEHMAQEVGATSGWCDGITAGAVATDLEVQLQIDLRQGTAVGTFSGSFDCQGTRDCDDPGEHVTGRLEGEIVDGWARPDGQGGWEWGGAVDARASMSAKRLCIRIDSPDHPSEFIWAEGSTSKQVAGFLSGNSWGFPGGYEGLWFDLAGPDAAQWEGRSHLSFDVHCVRPSCPLPRSVPPPP
jgi:hypothetical protein